MNVVAIFRSDTLEKVLETSVMGYLSTSMEVQSVDVECTLLTNEMQYCSPSRQVGLARRLIFFHMTLSTLDHDM